MDAQEADRKAFPFSTAISLAPILKYLETIRKEAGCGTKLIIDAIFEKVADTPALKEPIKDKKHLLPHQDLLSMLMDGFLPNFQPDQQMGYVVAPFSNNFLYATPKFQQILNGEENEILIHGAVDEEVLLNMTLNACRLVLSRFYNRSFDPSLPNTVTVRNRSTGLERHYRLNLITDFIDPAAIKPVKEIDEVTIHELIKNPKDIELWTKHIPGDHFELQGLALIYLTDQTNEEVITQLNNRLLDTYQAPLIPELEFVQGQLRSFFQLPKLQLGVLPINAYIKKTVKGSFKNGPSLLAPYLHQANLEKSIYAPAMKSDRPLIIDNLQHNTSNGTPGPKLENSGIKSLMLIPILNMDQQPMAIIELGAPNSNAFNQSHLIKLESIIPILQTGFNRKQEAIENRIRRITQNQFTSLHASVQWKFREIAIELMKMEEQSEQENVQVPPILFNQVHPLYGQADIVGSSTKRNEAILTDLSDNLIQVQETLEEIGKSYTSFLIDHLSFKVQKLLEEIQNHFNSNDENRILELLKNEIHPFLEQISKDQPKIAAQTVKRYFNQLDPMLGFIYRKRKAFEDSVAQLNSAISNFIEEEDEKMQAILPHYFEKYSTDGVEYNMYLGQSLLRDQQFSVYKLRDFRIWQLINMCQITQKVAGLQDKLPEPLTTAQLIFIYSDTLDIRFRMDEKQFDVDGAYNVRYEILKKRIDKAYIEGTSERLTQSGKIAIVYLHSKDRLEYMEYLNFLASKGYIAPEIENLKLGKLQGVDGLQALRVTVNT